MVLVDPGVTECEWPGEPALHGTLVAEHLYLVWEFSATKGALVLPRSFILFYLF